MRCALTDAEKQLLTDQVIERDQSMNDEPEKIMTMIINHNYAQFSNVLWVIPGVPVAKRKAVSKAFTDEMIALYPPFGGQSNEERSENNPDRLYSSSACVSGTYKFDVVKSSSEYPNPKRNDNGDLSLSVWHRKKIAFLDINADQEDAVLLLDGGDTIEVDGRIEQKTGRSGKDYFKISGRIVGGLPRTESRDDRNEDYDTGAVDDDDLPF